MALLHQRQAKFFSWGVAALLEGMSPSLHLVQLCEFLPLVLKAKTEAASLKVKDPL